MPYDIIKNINFIERGIKMEHTIQKVGNNTWYCYQFSENSSCTFELYPGNVVYIRIRGNTDFEQVKQALNDITDHLSKSGIIPQINIKKKNHYLQCLVRQCGYYMIAAKKFSFNIWRYKASL